MVFVFYRRASMGSKKDSHKEFQPMRLGFNTPDVADAPGLVVGRDRLAEDLWEGLSQGSLRLLSERRMGKTWLLKLALARAPGWAAPLFFDAQQAEDACDFVLKLNRQLHAEGLVHDNWWGKAQDWFQRLMVTLGGKKVGPVEVPANLVTWSGFLTQTCEHATEHRDSQKIVLVFDELPLFLDKLVTAKRPQDAVTFLDTLRFLRQNQPNLRMVFCGSLGLHIVLKKLEATGYTGRPVNDMHPFGVPPLDKDVATGLAGGLMTGEDIACKDIASCARAVAKISSGCPFYIQKIVKWMKDNHDKPWTAKAVHAILAQAAQAAADPFEFRYYDGRLTQHYPDDSGLVDKARIVLDILSREEKGLAFDQLLNHVRHHPKSLTLDPQSLLEVLRVLQEDHYLTDHESHWQFKLDIIRQGWFYTRGRHNL